MKKYKTIIIVLLLAISSTSKGIDTTSIKYMPLHAGDFWVYNGYEYSISGGGYFIAKMYATYSIIKNSHIYYYLYSNNSYLFNGLFRADSITGSIYKYDSTGSCLFYNKDKLIDSLAAVNGDSTKNCNTGGYKCMGTQPIIIFSDTTFKITFTYYQSIIPYGYFTETRAYVRNFGFYLYSSASYGGGGGGGYSLTLKGCRLNGIVYGDTTLTFINKIGFTNPTEYFLFQNYPNPFNPVTKIRFEVPLNKGGLKGVVSLKVYDILGKEITTLVNEQLQPGTYEVTFDGSNLPSGVYFYQLRAGEYIETKKLVLLK